MINENDKQKILKGISRDECAELTKQLCDISSPTGSEHCICFGASSNMSVAHVVPLKAIIEPLERSMPPAMITTAAPKAKMPNRAVWRAMSTALGQGCVQ